MNKYDRMLHILNLLRTRKNMNAETLARECNVTERTIYRDIFALSDLSIPIYYDNGYKLASDNFLPPLNFTFDEYQLLKLSLESSPLINTDKYKDVYNALKAKIENCLSEKVIREKKYSPQTTHIEIPESDVNQGQELVHTKLEAAISGLHTIKMVYESITSGLTERKLDPYFIVFRGRAFYTVGYCHQKKEIRTFRLSRIREIHQTNDLFIKESGVSPETYFDKSWSVYSGEPVEVVVEFKNVAARVVETSFASESGKIEQIDTATIRYTTITKGTEEIMRWILGFGADAKVISPEELRKNILSIGLYIAEAYKSDNE